MGIFDKDENDEVKISPSEEEAEGNLRDEVETEIVGDSGNSDKSSGSSTRSRRGQEIRERSTRSRGDRSGRDSGRDTGSSPTTTDVSLKDIHRQNEKIIELLEELNAEGDNTETEESDFDGVL
jgi:flagellar motility protein MotE (MotC chaperone)